MKTYMVTGASVTIFTGDLALNEEQSKRRKNLIKETEIEGLFQVKEPVIFKKGEKFGYGGELDKVSSLEIRETVKRPGRPPKGSK